MTRYTALLARLLFALPLAGSACRTKETVTNRPTESVSLGDLSRELKLTFPPSTRLVGVDREQGMDDRIRVKVEMNSADVEAFLAQTSIAPSSFRSGARGRLGLDSDFWDPSKASKLRTSSGLREHRVLNIGIDETRPDVTALFIVDHGL
jgi:hypothetical protein